MVERTVSSKCRRKNYSTLSETVSALTGMSESSVGDVSINIKTINNDVYQFTVSTQSSVEELKALIRQRTNISEDRQRLIYRGRVLTDGSTIAEYHIENGHTIQFVARPENYRELQQSAVANDTATQTTTNIQQTTLDQMMREIFGGEATGTITTGNSETRQFGPSVSTPTALPTLDDGSLEHVRQGFLTLRTLLATMSNHDDDERNSEIGADSTPHPRFYPGQWVDVKDTVNQWLEATVMSVDYASNAIFVHYNGWPTRWDEWIPFNSPRIAPFRSRTAHSNALTSYVSPTPNVRISGAPSTGSDDVRTILPEIRNMLRRLQPMIEEAADIAEQVLVTSLSYLIVNVWLELSCGASLGYTWPACWQSCGSRAAGWQKESHLCSVCR